MRNFKDDTGKIAWIYDEYTHPKGLYYNKTIVKVAEKPIEVIKAIPPIEKPLSKVAKVIKKIKAKK